MSGTTSSLHRKKERNRWLLLSPSLFILAIAAVGPLMIVIVYSFLSSGDFGGIVWEFSWTAWFEVFFKTDIFDGTVSLADAHLSIFWRSMRLAGITTLLTFLIGFPTAYFIATRPKSSREIWLLLIMIPFWTNLLIRTFAIMELIRNTGTINSALTGLGIIDEPIQMLYTNFSVGLGMAYVYLPLMVLPLYTSLEKLDFSLVEAGYDLYATRFKVLWHVILPLAKPGIIAGSILVFVPALGSYVTPRVLGGGKNLMIGNLIELQFGQGRNWPLGAALSVFLLLIVVTALLFYVRTMTKGDTDHA
jgi:spermidine/putrescine transport system permease protein